MLALHLNVVLEQLQSLELPVPQALRYLHLQLLVQDHIDLKNDEKDSLQLNVFQYH